MPDPRRGFTAWETLVIVVLLIALAFLLVTLGISGSLTDQHRLSIHRLEVVAAALTKYAIDNGGQFPTTEQGLAALVTAPTAEPLPRDWQGPYLADVKVIKDAWGQEFHYIRPGGPADPPRPYDLWSLGRDGIEGGAGPDADILSWDRTTQLP